MNIETIAIIKVAEDLSEEPGQCDKIVMLVKVMDDKSRCTNAATFNVCECCTATELLKEAIKALGDDK